MHGQIGVAICPCTHMFIYKQGTCVEIFYLQSLYATLRRMFLEGRNEQEAPNQSIRWLKYQNRCRLAACGAFLLDEQQLGSNNRGSRPFGRAGRRGDPVVSAEKLEEEEDERTRIRKSTVSLSPGEMREQGTTEEKR